MVAGAEGTAEKQTKPLPSGSSCFAMCVCMCVCVCVCVGMGEAAYRKRNMLGAAQCQEEKQNHVRGTE